MLKHKEQLLEARKTLEEKRERARSYVKETTDSIQSLRRELEDNNRKRKETSQRESELQETLNETMKRLTEFKVDRRGKRTRAQAFRMYSESQEALFRHSWSCHRSLQARSEEIRSGGFHDPGQKYGRDCRRR